MDGDYGEILWLTPLPNAVNLLGMSQGRIYVAADRLWCLDARCGKIIGRWPNEFGETLANRGRGAFETEPGKKYSADVLTSGQDLIVSFPDEDFVHFARKEK